MSVSAASAWSRHKAAIRMLIRHGEQALRPQFVNEKWRRPLISMRKAAVIRKGAIKDGTYGSFDPENGKGWNPMWDTPRKITSLRLPKETKRERTREARASKIESLLEQADDRIETYRLEKEALKPEPGVLNLIKKMNKGTRRKK
uniref:Large ribosomal subunit protein mL59 domain-containing protein n=1 Tax=Odontella aurita TaxID=265563 RepID=A0A7S4KCW7_9STRA|mmetsp:Transcript_9709/g.29037  ORF Transcript_9709/g.29037 Transcript_9709/m.29037 type:complete len:145 (+) Transcript_9709:147-581(+)|eukprot:CAMPEP_0113526740 /NCGR_PEP_ID=MMETSP0015_2-20120614/912_1 /TAXON_ID=2838 /ORGANISM="Odontella" /LENGTH=144 /DNA_ID=CAMNT_0000425105 /DNA_START=147 /DNA_END=581 /DNA_ORIENTATION=+ /assembly_acc=CAM_ASM_000160